MIRTRQVQYLVIENDGMKTWTCARFVLEAHAQAFVRVMEQSGFKATWAVKPVRARPGRSGRLHRAR